MPDLLIYSSEAEYRQHYIDNYCTKSIFTHDDIRVFFSISKFEHAFFESSFRNGVKDKQLSKDRAERMDWIALTLQNEDAVMYQGWDRDEQRYAPERRVCIAYDKFIVAVGLSLNKIGELKGNFITCYYADNSYGKITASPLWSLEECMRIIGG